MTDKLEKKPHIILRFLLLLVIIWFMAIENNPLVRLEAILGLSPPPIERFFGMKSLFSGMTEGVQQFVRLNFESSIESNIFSPLIVAMIIFAILTWNVPKLDSKEKEYVFFCIFILLSAVVNLVD